MCIAFLRLFGFERFSSTPGVFVDLIGQFSLFHYENDEISTNIFIRKLTQCAVYKLVFALYYTTKNSTLMVVNIKKKVVLLI